MLSSRIGEWVLAAFPVHMPAWSSATFSTLAESERPSATRQENRVEKIVRKVYGYANQVSYITGAATFPLLAAKAGWATWRQAIAEEGPCTGLRNRISGAIRLRHIRAEEDPCI